MKEKIAKEASLAKASEAHIEAYYYFRMSKSKACWKTEEEVDRDLPQIKSKNDKLNAVKENIQMRVKGYGWKDFTHPWSKNGKLYTEEELSVHLKSIIRYEKQRLSQLNLLLRHLQEKFYLNLVISQRMQGVWTTNLFPT